jgi:hypothetical protein
MRGKAMGPLIAIAGSVTDRRKDELKLVDPEKARKAAEETGRALAKAGCRILIYSTDPDYVEFDVLRGYVGSKSGTPYSIQVRYPLGRPQAVPPDWAEQDALFEWVPTQGNEWEIAYYRSVEEVDGMFLVGGGYSTLVGGLVAMGHNVPIVALAAYGGAASKVWEALSAERGLATRDEISFMARPQWTEESGARCIQILAAQRQRQQQERERKRLEEIRKSGAVSKQAIVAMLLFLIALAAVPIAWSETARIGYRGLLWILFFAPIFGGVSGATIRMVFDWRQGSAPYTAQGAWITSALGLVAGGVSGLLFISAQLSAIPDVGNEVAAKLQEAQASRLVPFALAIGFVAGLTLDAVFRKLTGLDVVRTEVVEVKKR